MQDEPKKFHSQPVFLIATDHVTLDFRLFKHSFSRVSARKRSNNKKSGTDAKFKQSHTTERIAHDIAVITGLNL